MLLLPLLLAWQSQTAAPSRTAASCDSLASAQLPNTRIIAARAVVSGNVANVSQLPPFCRVSGEIKPTSDSEILFELWMPLEKWNGRFSAVGNPGWGGAISTQAPGQGGGLAGQLRRGYATASTNTGHRGGQGAGAEFAFGHPERLVDFGHRAHHETAVAAKALVKLFYGTAPKFAYFFGSSSGGLQGLMEAQRYPTDYDGIVVNAPTNNWTRQMGAGLDAINAVLGDTATRLPKSALRLLYQAALASCDTTDGVADGLIGDPRRCSVDYSTVRCQANVPRSDECLTAAQLEAARRVHDGFRHPATRELLFPGLSPGSELGWDVPLDPDAPHTGRVSFFRWIVFSDSTWTWKGFDLTAPNNFAAYWASDRKYAPILNATDPNLRAFRDRGGKLIHVHGLVDPLIPPSNSIAYYESVISAFGGGQRTAVAEREVMTFYRLFLVPGVGHQPANVDLQSAIENWVERGTAPATLIATLSVNGETRPRLLCPHPSLARHTGNGNPSDVGTFACR